MSITDIKRGEDDAPPLHPVPDTIADAQEVKERPLTTTDLVLAIERFMKLHLDETRKRTRRRILYVFGIFMIVAAYVVFGGEPDANVVINDKPEAVLPLPGASGTAHVAIIPIDGMINGDILGPPVFANTTLYIHDTLELVEARQNVAAVIFYINSNGGDAVASAQGYRMIKQFRERTKIPVYAYVSSHAYSGGYYLALGADRIIVDPEASVGNIGVIMRLQNYSRLAEAVGVVEEELSTGPNKNAGSPWHQMSEGQRAMMQREIDHAFMRFLTAISESRHIPMDTLIAESKERSGRTSGAWFSAKDAIDRQLADKEEPIDQLYRDIQQDAAKQKQWKKIEFVRYDKKLPLLERWKDGTTKSIQDAIFGHRFTKREFRAE